MEAIKISQNLSTFQGHTCHAKKVEDFKWNYIYPDVFTKMVWYQFHIADLHLSEIPGNILFFLKQ